MALVVQDDTGEVSGANGYISVAYFRAHHEARGVDHDSFEDEDVESAVVRATDYLDTRFRFLGVRLTETQTTEWPRSGVPNPASELDEDFDVIPEALKQACAEYTLLALSASLFLSPEADDTGRKVAEKEEQVGPIKQRIKYDPSLKLHYREFPLADSRLRASGIVVTRSGVMR